MHLLITSILVIAMLEINCLEIDHDVIKLPDRFNKYAVKFLEFNNELKNLFREHLEILLKSMITIPQ